MGKSVILPLAVARGTRIFVEVDPKFPYTVLYDSSAPPRRRVVAVIDKDEPVITVLGTADVRSLWLVGNVDQKAWEATKKALDEGNPSPMAWPQGPFDGPPGTAGDGNGRIS
jgi:hypothetical protein